MRGIWPRDSLDNLWLDQQTNFGMVFLVEDLVGGAMEKKDRAVWGRVASDHTLLSLWIKASNQPLGVGPTFNHGRGRWRQKNRLKECLSLCVIGRSVEEWHSRRRYDELYNLQKGTSYAAPASFSLLYSLLVAL
jgi:hypothetical protein